MQKYGLSIPNINGEMNVTNNLRKMRNIDDFPCDGGYSGALILESNEKNRCHGNEYDKYIEIYVDSLRDIPQAFDVIKKIKEQNI